MSRRVVPLQTSHLLEIDATIKTESQLSTDTLKYLCEQGAVRSLSISISHIHTHRYTTQTQQVRVNKALQTLEELPEPILEQCTTVTKHYQSCLDMILRDYDDENYAIIGGSLDKAARGKRLGFDMMNITRAIRSHIKKDANYFGSKLQKETDKAVHRFNNTRIGIRLLNDTFARAFDPKRNTAYSAVGRGVLHPHLAVDQEIERAASFVESIAVENLYMCPDIVVRNRSENIDDQVSYVPAHVWYVVFRNGSLYHISIMT